MCLRELADYASCIYDVTIAYNNTRNPQTGQRTASPGMPGMQSVIIILQNFLVLNGVSLFVCLFSGKVQRCNSGVLSS